MPEIFLNNIPELPHLVSLTLRQYVGALNDYHFKLEHVPRKLEELNQLKYLNLEGNKLSDFSKITTLQHLKTIHISNLKFQSKITQ